MTELISYVPYKTLGEWRQPPKSGRAGLADLAVLYNDEHYHYRNLDASLSADEALAYAEQQLGINQVWVLNPLTRAAVPPRTLEELIGVVPAGDLADLDNLKDWQITLTERALAEGDVASLDKLLAIVNVPATTRQAWAALLASGIPDPDWQPGIQTSERLATGDTWPTPPEVEGWTWDGMQYIEVEGQGLDIVPPSAYDVYQGTADAEPEAEPQGKLAQWWTRVTGGGR